MSQWRVFFSRLIRCPWTVVGLLADRLVVPLYLRGLGVTTGLGCRFTGQPVVTIADGARVILGDNVSIYSRYNSNPAGLPHPTILAALAPGCVIRIGDNTGISGAAIAARCGITIGKNVLIGAGACIWDTDFHPVDPYERRTHPTHKAQSAPVCIHDDAFIGARAMILKGVTIGWGAVVGAGAVVTKDVEACQIAAGNPARIIGSVLRQHQCAGEQR